MSHPDPAQLIDAPDWLLHRGDPLRGLAGYIHAPTARLALAPFHDERLAAWLGAPTVTCPLQPIAAALGQRQRAAPPRLLLHTAFCCSTLLARLLASIPGTFAVREPLVLRDLITMWNAEPTWERNSALLAQILAHPPRDHSSVLIKPSNLVNPIAGRLVRWLQPAGVIVMSNPLRQFLISVLKKTPDTQRKMPQLVAHFARWCEIDRSDIPIDSTEPAPDRIAGILHAAAWTWALQRHLLIRQLPEARWLDANDLLARKPEMLGAVLDSLGIEQDQALISALHTSPEWASHAKSPGQAYGAADKRREDERIHDRHHDAIEDVCAALDDAGSGLDFEPPGARRIA